MSNVIDEARAMLKTVVDEVLELDVFIQLFDRIREIVLANDAINKENDVFWLMTVTYFDSVLTRLRRLVDTDRRTNSVVTLIRYVAKNHKCFTREWHGTMYADAQDFVRRLEPKQWQKRADQTGAHLCPDKLAQKAKVLAERVRKCKAWVDSTIAHLDRRRPTAPSVDEFKDAVACVKETTSNLQ